jgi:heterodisulfide reductase subunit B
MMRFALFLGCTIPARLPQFESSSRAVFKELGVSVTDIEGFNCCGYPLRNTNFKTFLLFSARSLALAERENLPMMTLCQCCYGSLRKAAHLMKENPALQKEINAILRQEGLTYNGTGEVRHFLSVLFHDIGIESIQTKVRRTYEGLKIATHYGCHVLRPSAVVQFDDPVAPSILDRLVEATGAESIDWATKLECCGAPVRGVNDDLSMDLTRKKLRDGSQSGADYLCSACPYCHIQFDTVQKATISQGESDHRVPPILYPQLLGLTMGIDRKLLGLEMNQVPIDGIEGFLSETQSESDKQTGDERGSASVP